MIQNWTVEEALRHARHDFMNQLQLIKGNLDLNRVDQAKLIIDGIVMEAQRESMLSKLKSPNFVEWLLTYNWTKNVIHLEYDIIAVEENHRLKEDVLVEWLGTFLKQLENQVELMTENNLCLKINITSEESRFILDFQGIIKDEINISKWLKRGLLSEEMEVTLQSLSNKEIVLELIVKS
ncbi:Spo0B C-terminal domain-containing protein [Bacillus spongiae]|uniref:Spo0B C-terminal domain-containing protein n=1 Tax=Bacillus spongiae TaxID=2683610 RepID=A0ABU8H913_9BACI